MAAHHSDSRVQQAAEYDFRAVLSELTGLTYAAEDVRWHGHYVKCDAVGRDAGGTVVELAEIYARQDELHGAQPKKLSDDAARLMVAKRHCHPDATLRLVSSPVVIEQIQRSWRGLALTEMGIELTPIRVEAGVVASIKEAQHRQTR